MDRIVVFLLCVSTFVGLMSPVIGVITNPSGAATLKEKQSEDLCVYQLQTSPPAFSCSQTTSSFPMFALQKRAGDTDYCVYFLADQGALTSSAYNVSFTCDDDGNGNIDSSFANIGIITNTAPTFDEGASVTKTVDASTISNGNTLFNVPVTDSDGDALVYSLDSTFTEFQIDPPTGNLLAKVDFSRVGTPTFNFRVQVTDGHHPAVEQTVTLNLNNLNTAPQITNLVDPLSVNEDRAPGILYKCTHDETVPVTVALQVNPPSERSIFDVNAQCEVSLKAGEKLDFEKVSTMTMTLTLDDGVLRNSVPFTFNVLNVNEPPSFASNSYTLDVDEGPVPLTPAIQPIFSVSDEDTGDTITFSLAPGTYDTYFTIDGSSGALTLIKELDYDTGVTQVQVTVVATDSGGLTATTTLTVNVADINDNDPSFTAGTTLYISPKTPVGFIGRVVGTDLDSGRNAELTYAMISDNSGGRFLVQPDGSIYLLSLVTEAQRNDVYSVGIRATDGGATSRSGDTVVTIVFDPPPVITNIPNTVFHNEDITTKTSVFQIDVTDNNTFVCVADDVRPPSTTNIFVVEKVGTDWFVFYTGLETLSFVTTPTYFVDVICTDSNGGQSIKSTLTVQVRQNQPPTLTCNPSVSVDAATATIGTTIHTIVASDTEPLSYSISIPSAPGIFNIGPTGEIFAQRQMIRETVSEYRSVITVADTFNSVSCSVTFTMTNTNEAPVFSNLNAETVREDLAAGSLITEVTIVDTLECDTTTFTMDVVPDTDTSKFETSITGKVISVRLAADQRLDHETQSDYEFYFRANDGCLPSQTFRLLLTVTNVNEPPLFLSGDHFVLNMNENGPGGSMACNGWDADPSDSHSLVIEGPQANLFSLSNTGLCTLTPVAQLDLDTGAVPDIITLTMKLIDAAMLSATATVKVYVNEVNDNPPICDQAAFSLSDIFNGDPVGRSLGRVTATDADIGVQNRQLTYSIISPSSGTNVVDMKSDGEFTVVADPEAQFIAVGSVLGFTVRVTDKGNPPLSTTCRANIQYIYTTTTVPPPTTVPTVPPTVAVTTTVSSTGTGTGAGAGTGTGSAVDQALSNPVVLGLIAGMAALAAVFAIIGLYCCCKEYGPCSSGKGGNVSDSTNRYDYRNDRMSRLRSRGSAPNSANIRPVSEAKPQAFADTTMRYL